MLGPGRRDRFLRGLAATPDVCVIGASDSRFRNFRVTGDGRLLVLDWARRAVVQEFVIPNSGAIADLRVLDEPDLCHPVTPPAGPPSPRE